tara:strand:+ start:606 stop:1322 length:717 start_codon:yes stop_codon:yes gene_type:complete
MGKIITYITVCLNADKNISQCIKSIIQQKTSEIEYIIIDGNSSDKTHEIIESFNEKIDFYKSENDEGVYHAMNKALNYANGEFICFINADDWLEEFTVKKIIENYNDLKNYDIFYGDQNIFEEDKKLYKSKGDHKFLNYFMSIPHQSAYVKKKIYEKIIYDVEYKISADYDLFLKLKKLNKLFKKLNFTFSNFRINGMSANKKVSSREFLIIQKKYNLSIIAYINYILRYRNFDCFKN